MNRGYLWIIPVVLIVTAIGAALLPAHGGSLPTHENTEGSVRVAVTPQDLNSPDTWRFAVQFNTHVTQLTQNMVAVSSLSDGNSASEKPTAWEGDPPGGHHRRGLLVFKAIKPVPAAITVHIREVGDVPDRSFTWKLGTP